MSSPFQDLLLSDSSKSKQTRTSAGGESSNLQGMPPNIIQRF